MYTKEDFYKDVNEDMQRLGLENVRLLNGKGYYFSEINNGIILHFALTYQKGEIEKLNLEYSRKYGIQFSCLFIRENGSLNEADFKFIYK